MGFIKFSELPTTPTQSVDGDDSFAILDVSANEVKRTTIDHASEKDSFGSGTPDKYGHVKTVNEFSASAPAPGEALSAYLGYLIAKDIGSIELDHIADHPHEKDDFFVFKGQFVHCTVDIAAGEEIAIGTNVEVTSIGDTFTQFKQSFQAGVDAVYEACIESGIQPSTSTPDAIATAIYAAADGTAREGDVLKNKTFLAGDQIRTGNVESVAPSTTYLNCDQTYNIPAGIHTTGGKVVANSLASQTPGDATAAQIVSNKVAWVGGERRVGTFTGQILTLTSSREAQTKTAAAGTYYSTVTVNKYPDASGTYTCPANWDGNPVAGGAGDMHVDNNLRFVNATNVVAWADSRINTSSASYAAGYADCKASAISVLTASLDSYRGYAHDKSIEIDVRSTNKIGKTWTSEDFEYVQAKLTNMDNAWGDFRNDIQGGGW